MAKEAAVQIHNGILLSHKKNTFESVLIRWLKLEPIVQSEVSQKKRKIMVLMNLFARQQWRNRHREQTYGHGERRERVRCMERVTWKLTLAYVK